MPAPFAADLCGYRSTNRHPNTSDANDPLSIELGNALFAALRVDSEQRPPGSEIGDALEQAVVEYLHPLRPDLTVVRSTRAAEYDQYDHLNVFPQFLKEYRGSQKPLSRLETAFSLITDPAARRRVQAAFVRASDQLQRQDDIVRALQRQMPEESLLKIDVSVGESQQDRPPLLHIALSSKWTLRTDRAQDCVSQGSKLVGLRRGRMPHYAVITMEPRPAMLKILSDGSGVIDCVYHLDLPALVAAVDSTAIKRGRPNWSPRVTLHRLLEQRRLRDFDDLVTELLRAPGPSRDVPGPVAQGGR